MPIVYASGKHRQSLPRTCRWSLATECNSPPMYWAGVFTRGSTRSTASFRPVFIMARAPNRWASSRLWSFVREVPPMIAPLQDTLSKCTQLRPDLLAKLAARLLDFHAHGVPAAQPEPHFAEE